jgi:lysophospholipase L1-like esterase
MSSQIFAPLLSMRMAHHNLASIEYPQLSWSSGLDADKTFMSHAKELKRLLGSEPFIALNSARSGDTSLQMLQKQLPEVHQLAASQLGGKMPDYVTILVGPNDLCANSPRDMRPVADYERNVRLVVDDLMKSAPNTKVMISSIPNVTKLHDVAANAPALGERVGNCQQVWQALHMCPTLTTDTDPSDRREVAARVNDYNNALQSIARIESAKYGDRVRFSIGPYNVNFNADWLSVDCFHPNIIGQNALSQSSWVDSWWAGKN